MIYNNWYILHGTFYCDIKEDGSYWKFATCKILSYNDSNKKISLIVENKDKQEFILDIKKMDPFFKDRSDKFIEFLKTIN